MQAATCDLHSSGWSAGGGGHETVVPEISEVYWILPKSIAASIGKEELAKGEVQYKGVQQRCSESIKAVCIVVLSEISAMCYLNITDIWKFIIMQW